MPDEGQCVPQLFDRLFEVTIQDKKLCPVGEGEIDLKKVADVGKKIGVEYFIVEQDRTRKGKDIMDEITISYKNMVKILS